jgi:hypothetical protein
MGLGGVTLFAPDELAALVGTTGQGSGAMVMQLLGGALFAIGFLDWMNRFATIGGIYGRPVVAANLAFFFIAATTFARRALRAGPDAGAGPLLWGALGVSGILALAYGRIMFASPRAQAAPSSPTSTPGGAS